MPDEQDSRHFHHSRRHNGCVIIDCALYRDGQRAPVPIDDLSDAVDLARSWKDGFVWIGLYEPTEEEFEQVRQEFDLHPLAVEDALHAHQRPKIDVYPDLVFLVLKTIRYVDTSELIETGEIAVFLGDGYILSVRHGEGSPLNDVRHRLEENGLLKYGPSAVLHAICDKVVDDYLDVVAELQKDIDDIEEQVFGTDRTADAGRIYNLKREVLEFKRAVLPLTTPLQKLAGGDIDLIHEECRAFFKDVLDHNLRAGEIVESYDSLLTSVLDANLAQVSVRQNDDMRRISAWVAIAAVPTLLAGIWGMNFDHMPELRWTFGYPLALTIMGTVCLTLHRLFKRSGWL
jgi:magnesium transporter